MKKLAFRFGQVPTQSGDAEVLNTFSDAVKIRYGLTIDSIVSNDDGCYMVFNDPDDIVKTQVERLVDDIVKANDGHEGISSHDIVSKLRMEEIDYEEPEHKTQYFCPICFRAVCNKAFNLECYECATEHEECITSKADGNFDLKKALANKGVGPKTPLKKGKKKFGICPRCEKQKYGEKHRCKAVEEVDWLDFLAEISSGNSYNKIKERLNV